MRLRAAWLGTTRLGTTRLGTTRLGSARDGPLRLAREGLRLCLVHGFSSL